MNNNKIFLQGDDLLQKLISGARKAAQAVGVSFGPNGELCAFVEQYASSTRITKDGATILRNFSLQDKFEDIAVTMLRDVSNRTANDVGDGTTASIIMAGSIFDHATRIGEKGNVYKKDFISGLKYAMEAVLNYTQEKLIIKLDDLDDLKLYKIIENIATTSANGSKQIGEIVAQAFKSVGKDGIITVESSKSTKTSLKITDGLSIDYGFASRALLGEEKDIRYENAIIFLTDTRLSAPMDVVNILKLGVSMGKPLVIIAKDFEAPVLHLIATNVFSGVVKCCPIKISAFGDEAADIFEDVAIFTGGRVFTENDNIDDLDTSVFGRCDKITVARDSTSIISFNKASNDILRTKIHDLQKELKETKLDRDRDSECKRLEKRIARLDGSAACIWIGDITESSTYEKEDLATDAVQAVYAAIHHGIVPGGCVNNIKIWHCFDTICNLLPNHSLGFRDGVLSVKNCILAPVKKLFLLSIASSIDSPEMIVAKIAAEHKTFDNFGFDCRSQQFVVNMIEAGIIDPAIAFMHGLRNAVEVSCTILNIGFALIEDAEKRKDNQHF